MNDSNSIRFAGDINIEEISIINAKGFTQNITNQIMAIEIYEDLFTPFISGVISVKESLDFTNLFPFIGEEYINIKLYTPSFKEEDYINQQFYIFKISDREVAGNRSVMYQLHFISREALVDVNKNVSKAYAGNISDIVKDICFNKTDGLESLKTLNIENTGNTTKFISNFWSPVKCLNYAAGTATTPAGASNYIFFESRKGLNFVSLDSLYDMPIMQEFVYDNYSRDIQSDGRSIINLNEDYKRILELSIPVVYDYIDRTRSGMFASKMISHDITTKKYVAKNFDMLDDFTVNKHLNNFAPASNTNIKTANSMVINYPKYYGVFNGFTDVSNSGTLQKRISQLQQAQSTKLEISVFGRTDYTVGMKVSVTLNRVQPISKEDDDADIKDTIFSGNYLVSAINHYINRDRHECTLELIKDSFIIDLNEGNK